MEVAACARIESRNVSRAEEKPEAIREMLHALCAARPCGGAHERGRRCDAVVEEIAEHDEVARLEFHLRKHRVSVETGSDRTVRHGAPSPAGAYGDASVSWD